MKIILTLITEGKQPFRANAFQEWPCQLENEDPESVLQMAINRHMRSRGGWMPHEKAITLNTWHHDPAIHSTHPNGKPAEMKNIVMTATKTTATDHRARAIL